MSLDPAQTQYAVDYARMVGMAYDAVVLGVGDDASPATVLFELAQLQELATSSLPSFGVVADADADFSASYDPASDPYNIAVAAGEVGYLGQRVGVPPQTVPLRRAYGTAFGSGHRFHVAFGLPMDEAAKASQVWTTVTSQASSAGGATVDVKDLAVVAELGFPLQAHVGGQFVVFGSLTADGQSLVVDPSYDNGTGGGARYGSLAHDVAKGTPVRFVHDPRIMAVYGVPVLDPALSLADFTYKVALPTDWLPIGEALVANPPDPRLASPSAGVFALASTVESFPAPDDAAPLFAPADANKIVRECASARALVKQGAAQAGVGDLIAALEDFTSSVADTPTQSFAQFWASRPFRPNAYFTSGVSFFGLERPEFTPAFARAYAALRGRDVPHTFAIFRGDLYDDYSAIVGTPPDAVTATGALASELVAAPASALARGSYVYGVSAVGASGESAPRYATAPCYALGAGPYYARVAFSAAAAALYYNVYRRSTLVGDQSEFLLTAPNEVPGYGAYAVPSLAYASEAAFSDAVAFAFVASGTWLNSAKVRLRVDAALTNGSDLVSVAVHADVGGLPAAVPLAGSASATFPLSRLGVAAADFVGSVGAPLALGSPYHLVVSLPSGATGANVLAAVDAAGAGLLATRAAGAWSAVAGTGRFDLLYGYVDAGAVGSRVARRGVRLTGRVATAPARLRVSVPPVDALTDGVSPEYALPSDADASFVADPQVTTTRNELVVTVVARSGATGTPATFSVTVPQGSARGWSQSLGTDASLFDRVDDVSVRPGAALRIGSDNSVAWSVYDLVTVETVP